MKHETVSVFSLIGPSRCGLFGVNLCVNELVNGELMTEAFPSADPIFFVQTGAFNVNKIVEVPNGSPKKREKKQII